MTAKKVSNAGAVAFLALLVAGCGRGTDTSTAGDTSNAGTGTVPTTSTAGQCGDGIRNGEETCDGSDLGVASCNGTLACDQDCELDWQACAWFGLDFDGQATYVTLPGVNLSAAALTWEAWVRPRSIDELRKVMDFGVAGGTGERFTLQVSPTGMDCSIDSGNGGVAAWDTSETGEWHHVACVWDTSGSLAIFVDSVEMVTDTAALTSDLTIDAASGGYLGLRNDGFFDGEIDEVRVWTTARTAAELQNAMSGRLVGDEEHLVGYWPLDEGTGQEVADHSPSGFDGHLGATDQSGADDAAWTAEVPW